MAFGVRTAAAVFAATDPNGTGRCIEIDCIRSSLAADVAEAAESRAAALGVGADRVLIAAGKVSEEDYLRALTRHIAVAFEPLDGTPHPLP